jgi:small-conductance mechanosensitive channel
MKDGLIITFAPLIMLLLVAFLALVLLEYLNRRTLSKLQQQLNEYAQSFFSDNRTRVELELIRFSKFYRVMQILVAVVSLFAALLAVYFYVRETNLGLGLAPFFGVTLAYAQGNGSNIGPNTVFLGYMLTAIVVVMLIVFLSAVMAVLLLKDTRENAGRRVAANDIVKTFGGFFIGVLTSFLKQAIGS